MSERCGVHGWAHAYKSCPQCSNELSDEEMCLLAEGLGDLAAGRVKSLAQIEAELAAKPTTPTLRSQIEYCFQQATQGGRFSQEYCVDRLVELVERERLELVKRGGFVENLFAKAQVGCYVLHDEGKCGNCDAWRMLRSYRADLEKKVKT